MHTTIVDLESISPNTNYQKGSEPTSNDQRNGQIYMQHNTFNRNNRTNDGQHAPPPPPQNKNNSKIKTILKREYNGFNSIN